MEKVVHTKVREIGKYTSIMEEANKDLKERNKVTNSRGNKVSPRKYHLSDEEVKTLKEKQKNTGKLQNPYKRRGVYNSLVQSLINLGENKSHRFIDVKNEMKNIMSTKLNKDGKNLWDAFYNKKSNNKSNLSQWDANTRIEQTAKILQRLGGHHPYGFKLKQLNACIDLLPSTDPLLKNKPNIRLNTTFIDSESVQPVKPEMSKKNEHNNT